MYVGERRVVTEFEEDIGAQDGGDDGADTVEGLRQVDSDLGIFRWAAHYEYTETSAHGVTVTLRDGGWWDDESYQ